MSGDVELWYALGAAKGTICNKVGIEGARERRWLWEAIQNLHASARINRIQRRRARNYFEYCFRLAKFPKAITTKLNWGEWVYFFDSLTVREEPRADRWLALKTKRVKNIQRPL